MGDGKSLIEEINEWFIESFIKQLIQNSWFIIDSNDSLRNRLI